MTYDVPMQFNRIRSKLAQVCKDFGLLRLQYSVFWGVLSAAQIRELTVECKQVAGDVPMDMRFIAVCQKCFEQSFGIVHNARLNTGGIIKLTTEPLTQIVSHTTEGWGLTRKVTAAKGAATPTFTGTMGNSVSVTIIPPPDGMGPPQITMTPLKDFNGERKTKRKGTKREVQLSKNPSIENVELNQPAAIQMELESSNQELSIESKKTDLGCEASKGQEDFTIDQWREILEKGFTLPTRREIKEKRKKDGNEGKEGKIKIVTDLSVQGEEQERAEKEEDSRNKSQITGSNELKEEIWEVDTQIIQKESEIVNNMQIYAENGEINPKEKIESELNANNRSSVSPSADNIVGKGEEVGDISGESGEWGVGCRFDQWGEFQPNKKETEENESDNPSNPQFLSIDDQTDWADKEFLEAVQDQIPQDRRELEGDQRQLDQPEEIPQHVLDNTLDNAEFNQNDIQEGVSKDAGIEKITGESTISISWGEPSIHRKRRGASDIDVLFV